MYVIRRLSHQSRLSRVGDRDSVLRLFGQVHNHIYANEGLSPTEALEEFIKILFSKLTDERENRMAPEFTISDNERIAIQQSRPNKFRERLEALFQSCKAKNPDIFSESESLDLKDGTLAYVVQTLQDVTLLNSDHDIKAIAFQKFIHEQQRGSRGQFLTPGPTVELGVVFCHPQPGDSVIDPACGTGSFLMQTLNFVKALAKGKPIVTLTGIDINPGVLRLARMNFVLQEFEPRIFRANSLAKWDDLPSEIKPGTYDDVLTNPPFGSQGRITDRNLLAQYELGHKWTRRGDVWCRESEVLENQTPQILFLERCIGLLRPGGRMSIVLPDSILQNPSLGYVRHFLRLNSDVLAVGSMPQHTFIPYGTGIKASIICLRKKDHSQLPVSAFFADVKNVGYLGDKSASPEIRVDSQGNPVRSPDGVPLLLEDITEVKKEYGRFLNGGRIEPTENCFSLDRTAINDRIDCEFYRPIYTQLEELLRAAGSVPLASIVKIRRSKVAGLSGDTLVKYVEISDVDSTNSEIVQCSLMPAHKLPSRASFQVRKGDLLTAVSGISTGTDSHASAIVSEDYDGAVVTSGFAVLTATEVNPYYLLSFLRTKYFKMQVRRYRVGSAIPDISYEDLKKVLVPRLPEELEREISELMEEAYRQRATAKIKLGNATDLMDRQLPSLA